MFRGLKRVLEEYLPRIEAREAAYALQRQEAILIEKMNPALYLQLMPGAVVIETKNEELKTIIIKGPVFDILLSLSTQYPTEQVSEIINVATLTKIGFNFTAAYEVRIEPEAKTECHRHTKRTEIVIKPIAKDSVKICCYDPKKIRFADVTISRSLVSILGQEYSIAIIIPPGIYHSMKNNKKNGVAAVQLYTDERRIFLADTYPMTEEDI